MNPLTHSRWVMMLDALLTEAVATNERRMVVISGARTATRNGGLAIWQHLPYSQRLWVGDGGPVGALIGSQVKKVLGSEQQAVVFDAWSGMNPDAFCAVAGTLSGGGLLVLLTPPLSVWPRWQDPDYARMLPYGYSPEQISGRFLQHVADALTACSAITCWNADASCQNADADGIAIKAVFPGNANVQAQALPARSVPTPEALATQNEILRELLDWIRAPCVPVVITADRGRGKSALLGRFAARCQGLNLRLVVTAANPSAAAQVLAWATRELQTLKDGHTWITIPEQCDPALPFIAPDALLAQHSSLDILLVDEAAMLPVTVLQQLIQRYPRIILASTVHGYEGSGRGLAIKLFPWLDREKPGWRLITLTAPMRWREGDPLEKWFAETFCLGDDVMMLDHHSSPDGVRVVTADELLGNRVLLHQVFGLLVAAHYRTTPSDLRDLLDGPNFVLWVIEEGDGILGVCLVAIEGPFADSALCEAIMAGRRRPRGHLLPQTMAFHCHSPMALSLTCARVVRIAIVPSLQGRGMGTRLLQAVEADLVRAGIELLGTSFALEPHVLRFWQKAGLQVLRVGGTRESASGLPACLMAKPLVPSDAAMQPLAFDHWREWNRLVNQFRLEARQVLAVLNPTFSHQLVDALLCESAAWVLAEAPSSRPSQEGTSILLARVHRFAVGAMPFESALGALQRWWRYYHDVLEGPPVPVDPNGVSEVLAGQISLSEYAQWHRLAGRAAAIEHLRGWFAASLAASSIPPEGGGTPASPYQV